MSVFNSFQGWKQDLTEWNEFLAEDLQNSRDAPQECFVPVRIHSVIYVFE